MLTTIKALHTAIYAVMVAAIFYVLCCSITGTLNVLLARVDRTRRPGGSGVFGERKEKDQDSLIEFLRDLRRAEEVSKPMAERELLKGRTEWRPY